MSLKAIMKISSHLTAEEDEPLLVDSMDFPPPANFTLARRDSEGGRVPQAIAHRGYKAEFPENTMGAFEGAVHVGAHAIETDLHISSDGVIVLSHDADLKRCFGLKNKIIDCDWSFLQTVRTLRAPYQPMPRLKDLLEYLATPGLEDIWILLDIKLDNNADQVMSLIASTIAEVAPSRPWNQRVVLGCWAAKYLPLCNQYLSGYPITHIGFSILYARQFLKVPNVSFNMLQKVMVGPFGNKFMRDCKRQKRAVFLWTVNDEIWMKWSIQKEVDGVITDDPKKYLEVCKNYDEKDPPHQLGLKDYYTIIWVNLLVLMFGTLFRYRYGAKVDSTIKRRGVNNIQESNAPPQKLTQL